MSNSKDIELIYDNYKSLHQSTRNTSSILKIIKEQYGLDDSSSYRLAVIFEQAANQKAIDDIVEYLLKPAPEGGGMTPEQVAQFGQELSKQDANNVEAWLSQTYPDVARAMQQLSQEGESEQEEYFTEEYHKENFFIEQAWNKSVLQFLSENISPHSMSWRKMLHEAASTFYNSNNILLEFSATGNPNQYKGAADPKNVNNFASAMQQVLKDYGQSAPPDVIKNIQSILDKTSQQGANTTAVSNIATGSTGTHTTNKGETRNVQVVNTYPENGSVEVQPLDASGNPKGSTYAIQSSKFTPSTTDAGSTNTPLPTPTGLNTPPAPVPDTPSPTDAGGTRVSPPPLPGTNTPSTPVPDTPSPTDANTPSTPVPDTPSPTDQGGAESKDKKKGFFSKLKGALGKGLEWVKNNKWKSLLYAGGLAALAGIAITAGPAAAGLAIANSATSLGTKIATGAGGIRGGIQAYKQSGAEGETGMSRFKSTAKGAFKGAGTGFLAGTAGGMIGQGVAAIGNAISGPQTADIGPPETVRTSPPSETPQELVDRGHEPLGDKGLDKFETQTGTEFDKASTADQSRVQTGQELNQQFPGLDASSAFENDYEDDVKAVLGLPNTGSGGAEAKEIFQSFLTDLQQTNPEQAQSIAGMKTGATTVRKLLQQWVQSGGASQINSSYNPTLNNDVEMIWESYKRIY